MNNPPLYIQLTNSDTGEVEDLLLSRIHYLMDFTDTQNFKSGTIIRTFQEFGALSPQGIIVSWMDTKVKEKKKDIHAKVKKVLQNYHKMLQRSMDEFNTDDEDQFNLFA